MAEFRANNLTPLYAAFCPAGANRPAADAGLDQSGIPSSMSKPSREVAPLVIFGFGSLAR